ncbi:MAG TPA: hypothetical protein VFD59_07965 [Nocardioidaceae bacterium]|nr:hypothetical protein [Nocardioidaceae bacterium]
MTTNPTDTDSRAVNDDGAANAGPGEHLDIHVTLGTASFSCKGDGDHVLRAFTAFREFYEANATTEPPAPTVAPDEPSASDESSTVATPTAADVSASGSIPLSVFLSQKKLPRGNHIIALGIAVWAKKYKGEEVMTVESTKTLWRSSKRKVPANIARDLSSAATEGWLERLATGAGNYAVTSYGEAHFEGLPASDE